MVYGQALEELGRANPAVVVLDADIADSCQTEAFRRSFPARSFDLGVAEQSLPTFAAGLALCGKNPHLQHLRRVRGEPRPGHDPQWVCYNRANVKIVGHSAGQTMGYTGPSHHTIEDVAAMRALPHVDPEPLRCPRAPADGRRARRVEGPVYLRLPRIAVPTIHGRDYRFEFGKTECLVEGRDVTLFSYGDVVHLALGAREGLAGDGMTRVWSTCPVSSPSARRRFLRHGRGTRAAVVIEDHNVIGGLGSAVAET